MMQTQRHALRWGLAGYGDLAGKRVAPALQNAAGSTLAGIWGRDPGKCAAFARKHGIPQAHASFDALLASPIDAVYVCTPPVSHAQYAIAALNAGKHVLVEKPMAASVPECERMLEAAHGNGLALGVAYYRRAFAKLQHVRRLLDEGAIGTITWINVASHGWFDPSPDDPKRWRVERSLSGGAGALADIGVHRLDLLDFWLGPASVVAARFQRLVHSYDVEDGCSALLELSRGIPAHLHFSWNTKTWMDRLEIAGAGGKIVLDPLDGDKLVVLRGTEREELTFPPPANAHLPCVQDFVDAVAEGRAPLCGGAVGLRANRLLQAIIDGAAERGPDPKVPAAAPQNDFPEFIETYYHRCRMRCPEIEGIAGKWTAEDLVPGLSDFDARLLVREGTDAAAWSRISMEVGRVHLELARERKKWARTLEHLPGVNLTWNEFHDPLRFSPEYCQWSFHHGSPERLAAARAYAARHAWSTDDAHYHWRRIASYYGRYDRAIDPPINLGAYESKYPLHSRLLHYLAPPVHSAVCLMQQRTTPGKLDAFRQARGLFPQPHTMDRVLGLIALHYDAPRHLSEPALTELEDELEAYLQGMLDTLLNAGCGLECPRHPTPRQLQAAVALQDGADPLKRLLENVRFARLMQGRLWFYGQDVLWFDSTLLIRNELNRIRINFHDAPLRLFSRLALGTEASPAETLALLAGGVLNATDAAACRAFAAAADPACANADLKRRALEIAALFEPFLHAIEKLAHAAVELAKCPASRALK